MERDHGRIVSVSTRTLGSVLDGDHAAGATSLVLFDAGDFDETGGTLSINGATLAYATCDDDTDTITLTDPLPAAALDGDFVACWDMLYGTAATVKTAMVQVDGDDDNPDPLECYVPHFLVDKLTDGDRGGPGEDVEIEYIEEDDEWRVTDVRGLSDQAGQKFEADDFYTLTSDDITAGTVTFPLSHTPDDESLTAWCGIPQPPTVFTIDYNAATITFLLAGFEKAGDEIWVHYAYSGGALRQIGITFSSGSDNPVTVPADAKPGNLMLLMITLPSNVSGATDLNGYTLIGETASVTHAAFNDTYTYRLAIYARTAPSGTIPVPTFPASTNQTPWVLAAVHGSTGVKGSAFDTLADGQSADTPALNGADVRVWATIANKQTITSSKGIVAASSNGNDDINIVAVTDSTSSAVPASVAGTAGWMMTTLDIGVA